MCTINIFDRLSPYFVDHPRPIIGAETIQLIIMREVLDYTVLRTEDTRELNTVHTPFSISNRESVRRVAFLGTKQKAAESRQLEYILRTAVRSAGLQYQDCYLKDNLCLQCPRCGLYGGTSTVAGRQSRSNIKHRIEYSTAFSLLPFDDINSSMTFNAIDDYTQTTGQALGQRFAVQPATLFPSIVTLKSITRSELVLTIKTLLSCRSYGAESRIGGDVRNTIWGVVAGWEEVITSLELTLELMDHLDNLNPETVREIILNNYIPMAGNPNRIIVFASNEVDALVNECANIDLNRAFLEDAYNDITNYRNEQLNS